MSSGTIIRLLSLNIMTSDAFELNAGRVLPAERSFFSRHGFSLLVGVTVLVISFAYGLSVGFSRRIPRAEASANIWGALPSTEYELHRITLPQGVTLVPIGEDLALNGRSAEMAAFVSRRTVQEILAEIVAGWEAHGLTAVGAASKRRGIAFAVNRSTGESYSAGAWIVPPSYRKTVSRGLPVQGFVAVGVRDQDGSALPEEEQGLVPGVPIAPDGKAGAVLSSKDPHGRSYTGTYTNPGTIQQNIDFYRTALSREGWREADAGSLSQNGMSMIMQRGSRELVLLFSEVPPSRTLVTIALGSRPLS